MEITLDGEGHLTLQSNPGTLGEALVEVNTYLQANGRALQAVRVDGREVPAEELTPAFGQRPVSDVKSLELTSARLIDLVRESLAEVEEVLPELPVACQTLAGIFAGDQPEEGSDGFAQLIAIWQALRHRRAEVIGALELDDAQLLLDGRSLREREAELADLLGRAQQAVGTSDHATASDLLAYDLSTMAEQEASIISLLYNHCANAD